MDNSSVPYTYSFEIQEKAEPAPVLEFKLGTKVLKSPPRTLKWGKSFTVSIAATGSGGASCEMYFQNLAWPSRKGVTSFRLTAGKTTNIVIRPWARIFVQYPVKYVCVEDGWPMINSDRSISLFDKGKRGGTLGTVTIVPWLFWLEMLLTHGSELNSFRLASLPFQNLLHSLLCSISRAKMWVVRDSLSNLQTIPFDPLCGYIRSWLITNVRDCQGQIKGIERYVSHFGR